MKREKAFIKANGSLSDLLEVADWLWQYLRKNFGKSEAYTLNVEESKKVCSAFSKRYGLEYGFQAEKYIKGLIYDREVAQKYSIEFPTNFGQYNIVMFKRNSTDSLNCITNIIHKFMTTKKTIPKKTAKKSAPKAKKTTTAKKTRKATEKQLEALKKAREARAEAKKAENKAAKAKAEAKKTITKAKATAKKVKASAKKSIKKALTSAKKQVRKTVSKATSSTRKRLTKSTKSILDRTTKSLKKKGLAGESNYTVVYDGKGTTVNVTCPNKTTAMKTAKNVLKRRKRVFVEVYEGKKVIFKENTWND